MRYFVVLVVLQKDNIAHDHEIDCCLTYESEHRTNFLEYRVFAVKSCFPIDTDVYCRILKTTLMELNMELSTLTWVQ